MFICLYLYIIIYLYLLFYTSYKYLYCIPLSLLYSLSLIRYYIVYVYRSNQNHILLQIRTILLLYSFYNVRVVRKVVQNSRAELKKTPPPYQNSRVRQKKSALYSYNALFITINLYTILLQIQNSLLMTNHSLHYSTHLYLLL